MSDINQLDDKTRAPVSQRPHRIEAGGEGIGANITVTIDGQDVKVPMGTTILEAAEKIGIRMPTLWHHKDLCVA